MECWQGSHQKVAMTYNYIKYTLCISLCNSCKKNADSWSQRSSRQGHRVTPRHYVTVIVSHDADSIEYHLPPVLPPPPPLLNYYLVKEATHYDNTDQTSRAVLFIRFRRMYGIKIAGRRGRSLPRVEMRYPTQSCNSLIMCFILHHPSHIKIIPCGCFRCTFSVIPRENLVRNIYQQ